ncbi:HU family DNA-binding protein [Parabacteroides distasonis]|uniref:DNA-binding protein n=1 Tax=Parabacteroides distasonis TaxID=823 RepID=A0A5C6KL50_PARDI|nr:MULTISPECIES: HU family DNA-binding protein [Parabacteroides]MDB9180844.1 HU family DNA-binding protein [Parabacteroides distasonis]MDB9220908.1 HU family DNA-binding protein [Parabacteroides distasonis]MDO5428500.1 HU family DNA-binding protein [Parabacteroides sp.]TWV63275.1 DNA-binding protein [Parabacteroides distasonis]
MSANYKLVRNPNPNPEESGKSLPLHPRLVSCGTIHTDEFINRAKSRSSFSPADMKGILQLFQDMMVDFLMFGYNVELEGIGTFSVSLKSRPVMEKNEIRAESIHFKDVKFRSSKELRDRLKTMPVFRDEYTVSDPAYPSAKECEQEVFRYLETNPFIHQKKYMSLCGCSRSKASLDLRRLVEEGKLRWEKLGTSHLYYKVEEPVSGETNPK